MKAVRTGQFFTGVFVFTLLATNEAAEPATNASALSSADQKVLDDILKQFVFDPKGAQYVHVKTTCRTAWASTARVLREGWLVRSQEGKPARVYFVDGDSIAAPDQNSIKTIDFVEHCRTRYAEAEKPASSGKNYGAVFERIHRAAADRSERSDLVLAAWLHRLEQPALAAKAMAEARRHAAEARRRGIGKGPAEETEEDYMVRLLKEDLAWTAFAGMVHAYTVRADDEALAHGERLVRLYPEAVKKEHGQADAILGDLKRRKAKGTFGKTPPERWPEGFSTWDPKKKMAWLIESLDEVDGRRWAQPRGMRMNADSHVAALIDIGDPAVPALIDTVEKDERLTRSVHFREDIDPRRTVLGVREVALTAVEVILKVRVFNRVSTSDTFTARGPEEAAKTARRLREYWKSYGGLPIDERMMKTLTDPKADFTALREAAGNLGSLGEEHFLRTTFFSMYFRTDVKRSKPAVARFTGPTAAEAILAAMDRDLAHHDADKHGPHYEEDCRRIVDSYLGPLVSLDDQRIARELADRFKAATKVRMRRNYAAVCHDLGDPGPMKILAREVEQGLLRLPDNNEPYLHEDDQPGNVEIADIVASLTRARMAQCDCALDAMTASNHPYHALVVRRMLKALQVSPDDERVWFAHPFCLTILRGPLDDTTSTGVTWTIEENMLASRSDHGSCIQSIPEYLKAPVARRQQAAERQCDRVALYLGERMLGLSAYNPLQKDAEVRLAAMRRLLDRYQGRFRLLTDAETKSLDLSPRQPMFVPDIRPLDHTATAEDVAKGLAVFHLDGKGKPADAKLPATATLRQEKPGRHPVRVLVVQAEVSQDGKTTYGILGADGIRPAAAEELQAVTPIEETRVQERKNR